MKAFKIDRFKGLAEHIAFADKSREYAESMSNLNVDDPLGDLTFRDGYLKKYSDTFTNIISALEYKMPTSGGTILLINDNGTLEWYLNGAKQTNITLPTGAAIDATFKNQMFGHNDSILITTGCGATNYMLWFGYIDRSISDGTGMFANAVEYNSGTPGYECNKAQIICPNGMFHNLRSSVKVGDFYYFSFYSSCYIEKRDTNFRLIERFKVNPSDLTAAYENRTAVLCTDDTYIYAVYNTSNTAMIVVKIDPDGWVQEASYNLSAGGSVITAGGICTDGTHVYVNRMTNDHLLVQLLCSDMTAVTTENTGVDDILDIDCDLTASIGNLYTLKEDRLEIRSKVDLSVSFTNNTYSGLVLCKFNAVDDEVWVSTTVAGVRRYDDADSSYVGAYTNISWPRAFIEISGVIYGVCREYGTVEEVDDTDTMYPGLLSLAYRSATGGTDLATGTYFYKVSIVDLDGQEFTLSDPIVVIVTAAMSPIVNLVVNQSQLSEFYRVSHFNLYRAYSSVQDDIAPETDYKFLKKIEINSSLWAEDTDEGVYYYAHRDTVSESNISTVTYFQNSGISDETKPRHVNPKYMTWLDSQLHVANFYYDGDTYKNLIIRSPLNQPANIAFDDYYEFGSAGYEILGMTNAFGRTVVFKQLDFGVFYDGRLEFHDTPGIRSQLGFCKNGDDVFFCNAQGVFHLRGHEKMRISDPVEVSWAGITDYTDAAMFIFQDKDRLIISYPGEKSFVYNLKYQTWVPYSTAFAFKNYFKNISEEYIGWGDPLASGAEYFWKIASGLDGRETNGTGGVGITVSYASGLLNFTNTTGMHVTLQEFHYRSLFTPNIATPITFTVYKYNAAGRATVRTGSLSAPAGSYLTSKVGYFDGGWGESFSWALGGIASTFQFSELIFMFHELGLIQQ